MHPSHDPVERSDAFDEMLTRAGPIARLQQTGRVNRTVGMTAVIGVVGLGILTPFTWSAVHKANAAAHAAAVSAAKANSNARDLYLTCISNNDFRTSDQQKWRQILAWIGRNPAAANFVATISTYVHQADALRDCTKLATSVTPAGALPAEANVGQITTTTDTTAAPSQPAPQPASRATTGTTTTTTRPPTTTTTTRPSTTTTTTCTGIGAIHVCRG